MRPTLGEKSGLVFRRRRGAVLLEPPPLFLGGKPLLATRSGGPGGDGASWAAPGPPGSGPPSCPGLPPGSVPAGGYLLLTTRRLPCLSRRFASLRRMRSTEGLPITSAAPSRSSRRSTLVSTLLTFWPPGPPERENFARPAARPAADASVKFAGLAASIPSQPPLNDNSIPSGPFGDPQCPLLEWECASRRRGARQRLPCPDRPGEAPDING